MRLPAVAVPCLALPCLLLFVACGGGGDDFCSLAADLQESGLGLGADDPAALERDVVAALDHLDRLVEASPDEIVADMVRVRDDFEALARGEGALGGGFAAATARVGDHLEAECGLGLDGEER